MLNVCIVRPYVHQGADVSPAPADSVTLEQLADLIKQHNGNGFRIVTVLFDEGNGDCSDGCDCHQKVLIEHPAVADALPGLSEDIISDRQVGNQIQQEPHRLLNPIAECMIEKVQGDHHRSGQENTNQHPFLLFIHRNRLPSLNN